MINVQIKSRATFEVSIAPVSLVAEEPEGACWMLIRQKDIQQDLNIKYERYRLLYLLFLIKYCPAFYVLCTFSMSPKGDENPIKMIFPTQCQLLCNRYETHWNNIKNWKSSIWKNSCLRTFTPKGQKLSLFITVIQSLYTKQKKLKSKKSCLWLLVETLLNWAACLLDIFHTKGMEKPFAF